VIITLTVHDILHSCFFFFWCLLLLLWILFFWGLWDCSLSRLLFSADVFSWESTVYLRNCGLGCPRAWRWPIRDEVHPYRALGLLRLLTPLPKLLLFSHSSFLYIYYSIFSIDVFSAKRKGSCPQ
jgi:hypothetical protein